MKRIGILAAVAAAVLAIGAVPLIVEAQAPPGPPMGPPPPITAKQREQGMAGAPAAVQAAKASCTVTDAYLVQSGTDSKTKVKSSIYEVACSEGPGYIVQSGSDGAAAAFSCLAQFETVKRLVAEGKPPSLICRLEPNMRPAEGYGKLVGSLVGQPCAASAARVMGVTPAGETYYEVACAGNRGYVLETSTAKPPVANDCTAYSGGNLECTLTTKAMTLARFQPVVAGSGKQCALSDLRFVGSDTKKSSYYEVACGATPGFMLGVNAQGAFESATDCARAQNIGGGCTLTVIDETKENSTYSKLAQGANYPCEVSKYRYLGKEQKSNSELVELACSNRPDGAIGLFPISGGKSQVFDCVQAGSLGVTCQLSKPDPVYVKYTERLASMGKTQCKVSSAKYLASTTAGNDLIETACSDGLPGFVISVDHATGATKELLTCGQARAAGAACTLPTNVAAR